MSCDDLLDHIKAKLPAPHDRAGLEKVSAGSGVPFHTLLKIVKGETADPRISTVQNLARYLGREAA